MKNLLLKWVLVTMVAGFCFVPATVHSKGYRQSGLIGQVIGLPEGIQQCNILVISTDRRRYAEVITTDNQLRFEIALKPGSYVLVPFLNSTPEDPESLPHGEAVPAQVEKKTFLDFTLVYTPASP